MNLCFNRAKEIANRYMDFLVSGANLLIFRPNKHKIFACSDAVHRRLRRKKMQSLHIFPITEQIQNFSEQMRPSQGKIF